MLADAAAGIGNFDFGIRVGPVRRRLPTQGGKRNMRWTFLLIASAMLAGSFGCCGPCGQWRPATYGLYGPCHGQACGHGGVGCDSCTAAPTCGTEVATCGCESAPTCGCDAPVSCGCEAAPTCGCDATASCGCEPTGCDSCGHAPCRCGLFANWPSPFAAFGACHGCGPLYWHEWYNDPPDLCDPCDCHGNWTGRGHLHGHYAGPPRAGSNSPRTAEVVPPQPTPEAE